MIKKGKLRWFRHLEGKDDTNWLKTSTLMKNDGVRQRRCARKSWYRIGYEKRWYVRQRCIGPEQNMEEENPRAQPAKPGE